MSGPGITGIYSNSFKNIAVIPNTTTPIAINQINNGYGDCQPSFGVGGNNPPTGPCTNCNYYVSNCGGSTVAYGGFTTVMTAKHDVQCGQTYHIKIAIADIQDAYWDSAIFLKKNSLTSSSLTVTPQPVSICEGSSVVLEAQLPGNNNPGTYLWQHSGETTTTVTVSPTVTTDYIVTYTHNGCEMRDTARVSVATPVTFSNMSGACVANVYSISGNIESTQIPGSGNLVIEDCNGIQTIIASAPFSGTSFPFNLTGLNADGSSCTLTGYFTDVTCSNAYSFTAPAACSGCNNVTITYTANNTAASCGSSDGKINLSGAGGAAPYSYSIDNGATFQSSGTFTNLPTGSYNIVVKDNNCCSTTGTENIGNLNGPSITNTTSNNPTCFGLCDGNIQITVSGGDQPYTYQWLDNIGNPIGSNSNSIANLCDGSYSVQVSDNNGCATNANITVTQPVVLNANFTGLNSNYCIEDPITTLIPTQTGGTFSGPGVIGNTFNPNVAGNGTHIITYTIGSGSCSKTQTLTVIVSGPTADFTGNPMITDVSNTEVTFDNLSQNATTYSWSFGDNSSLSADVDPMHVFPSNAPNQYTVKLTATDIAGCTATKIVTIIINALAMEYSIPNIFTPNGDGSNEFFQLIENQNVIGLNVIVMNRWGNIVFESTEVNFKWNGDTNNNGLPCAEGTYFYKMELKDMSGDIKKENGFVQLSRGK